MRMDSSGSGRKSKNINTYASHFELNFIPKRASRGGRIAVRLVFQRLPVQTECFLPPFPNLNADLLIAALEPEPDTILVFPDRHDGPVDLISRLVHGLPDNGEHGKEPPLVELALLGFFLTNGQDKLAPVPIGGIFPAGFDPVPKHRVIGLQLDLGRGG